MKLSHVGLMMLTAIAEPQAPTDVGSGDLLGSTACDKGLIIWAVMMSAAALGVSYAALRAAKTKDKP